MCLKGAVVLGLSKEPHLRQLYDQTDRYLNTMQMIQMKHMSYKTNNDFQKMPMLISQKSEAERLKVQAEKEHLGDGDSS